MPADFANALASEPRARAMFEMLTSQNRYAVLYRIENASVPTPEPSVSSSSWRCSPAKRPSTRKKTSGPAEDL